MKPGSYKHTWLLIFFLSAMATTVFAQQDKIDSLLRKASHSESDTGRVILYVQISVNLNISNADSAMYFANAGLRLSRKIKYPRGEAASLNARARIFNQEGNYTQALQLNLEALKIAEPLNDKDLLAGIFDNMGYIFSNQGDFQQSIRYFLYAKNIADELHDTERLCIDLMEIGDSYEKWNRLDSALIYTNRAYELALKINDAELTGSALNNLGNIYSKTGQDKLAMEYYRLAAVQYALVTDQGGFAEIYLGMAKLFQRAGQPDSCLKYARLSIAVAGVNNWPLYKLQAAEFLAAMYKSVHNTDSAYYYQSLMLTARDSLYSEEKTRAIQQMQFSENLREQELAEEKLKLAEQKRKNLQRGAIAVFIPLFFLVILFLSRIKVRVRIVEFLAVVCLLLLFEFIVDLIYPFVEDMTGDNPVWVTLIFVLVAALLEPVSNRLELWFKRKINQVRIPKTKPVMPVEEVSGENAELVNPD